MFQKKGLKWLKVIFPILLGGFFILLSYHSTTTEQRQEIWKTLRSANFSYVFLSLLMGIGSHLLRAQRWQMMLRPLGFRPKFWTTVFTVLIGYLANLGIPRSGEVLRATALKAYAQVPFEKSFGTIVTERLIDLAFLLLFMLLTAGLHSHWFVENIWLTIGVIGLLTTGILLLWIFGLLARKNLLKTSVFWQKLMAIFKNFNEGIQSIKNIKNKAWFILNSTLIWVLYLGMFDVIKYCFESTQNLTWTQMLPAFIAGAFAMATTNGGVGAYPLAVGWTLTSWGIDLEASTAFGWLMWTSQTLMILLFGGLSFLLLPLSTPKKNR